MQRCDSTDLDAVHAASLVDGWVAVNVSQKAEDSIFFFPHPASPLVCKHFAMLLLIEERAKMQAYSLT